MRTLFDHIEHVKGQPHHVRKRVALGSAGGIAAVVGILWFGGSLAGGAYAIHGSNFAISTGAESAPSTASVSGTSQLAGAAAALDSKDTGPARIVIVDSSSSAATSTPADQTTIPF
jgi:hypothetical protein